MHRAIALAFRTALLGLLLAAAPVLAGEEGPHAVTVFDVSALLEPVKDFPGPRCELSPGRALETLLADLPGAEAFEGPGRPALLEAGDLDRLLRDLDPAWDSDPGRIRLNLIHGRLFAQGPADAVDRLRETLKTLEAEAGRSYHVRALLVELPPGEARAILGDPGDALETERVEAARHALASRGGRVLADAAVVALNGQRVHVADGREQAFLLDYDVVLARDAAAADPVVEVFRDGLVLDVRPTASPSGARVRLDLVVSYALFDPEPVRFDPGNPKLGPLDLPRVTGFRMESSVALPEGRFLLLGPLMPAQAREIGRPR